MGKKTGPKAPHKVKNIDIEEVQKLAAMQCTTEEIAAFFDVSSDTIERNFAAIIKKGRAKGRMSMKRQLFQKVQQGDLGALIWWGKQFAGMAEKTDTRTRMQIEQLSDEELDEQIKQLEGK